MDKERVLLPGAHVAGADSAVAGVVDEEEEERLVVKKYLQMILMLTWTSIILKQCRQTEVRWRFVGLFYVCEDCALDVPTTSSYVDCIKSVLERENVLYITHQLLFIFYFISFVWGWVDALFKPDEVNHCFVVQLNC